MSTKTSEISFSRWRGLVAAGIIIVAALGAYHNSFKGPFIFDDKTSIPENQTIRQLFSIKEVLSPPAGGKAIQNRPIANLSLAINYAIDGTNVWVYHATNLVIHILAALTLFGIVRRTLILPWASEKLKQAAGPLGLIVALIWTVHPLATEAVTYVIQRTESMMGMFYLLSLYCVIRAKSSTRSVFWYVTAVIVCLLGMGSKEAMVTAPLVILVYDRVFLSGSFKEVFRRRWGLYIGLALTWGLLVILVPTGNRGTAAGFGQGMSWWEYARTQFGAIVHYLRLCFWPRPLVIDYGVYIAKQSWEIVPYAIIIVLLLAGVVFALRYRPRIGFLGLWFFVILAPSSSIVPLVTQTVAEKRMYLPLAAVVVAVVLGGYMILARFAKRRTGTLGYILAGVVIIVFGFLSVSRNKDYASEFSIWNAAVRACPGNHRAYNNRGMAHRDKGDYGLAIGDFDQAITLDPAYAPAYNNRGFVYSSQGNYNRALSNLNKAIELVPNYADAYNNRGITYGRKGNYDRAIADFNVAIELNFRDARAYSNRGLAYSAKGDHKGAIRDFDQAIALDPAYARAYNNLAWILATHPEPRLRDGVRAVRLAEKACELTGYKSATNLDTLAGAYAELGQFDRAVETAVKAVRLAWAAKNRTLAQNIQNHLELYRDKRPYRE